MVLSLITLLNILLRFDMTYVLKFDDNLQCIMSRNSIKSPLLDSAVQFF